MVSGPAPLCLDCKHLFDFDSDSPGFKCAAFPDGIPREIYLGDFEHTKPHPGDNGIMFEEKSE